MLGNGQETVEEDEQQAILNDQVEEIKHNLDERRGDSEDNIEIDVEHAQIEFIQQEDNQQITNNQ